VIFGFIEYFFVNGILNKKEDELGFNEQLHLLLTINFSTLAKWEGSKKIIHIGIIWPIVL
jgi:hypothetical protein